MLSTEKIKARATSPIEACKVSIEEWQYKAELPATDLAYAGWGAERCGLCEFFGPGFICNDSDKGTCPLCAANRADLNLEYGCCAEYSTAKTAWHNFKDGQATVAEVRSAFWAMVARLEKELAKLEAEEKTKQEAEKQATKKPERVIRHGDFGVYDTGGGDLLPRLFVEDRDGKLRPCSSVNVMSCLAEEFRSYYTLLDINIFDVMAEAMKGEKEYEVGGTKLKLDSDGDLWVGRYCFRRAYCNSFFQAILPLALQHKLAEAQK